MVKDKDTWVCVEVSGPDHVEFLHKILTCDVQNLKGQTLGFLLDNKGHILFELYVSKGDVSVSLFLTHDQSKAFVEKLSSFVLSKKVKIHLQSDVFVVRKTSPTLPDHLKTNELIFVVPDGCFVFELHDTPLSLDTAEDEVFRIERGIPKWLLDVDSRHFPLVCDYYKTGVSLSKGCYPGQETMARLSARGQHLAWKLFGLCPKDKLDALTLGHDVFFEDKKVGQLSTVCFSNRLKRDLALALIHRSAWNHPTEMFLKTGQRSIALMAVDLPLKKDSMVL